MAEPSSVKGVMRATRMPWRSVVLILVDTTVLFLDMD